MANTLKINREKKQIVMDRAFAKASAIVGSEEYKKLQTAKKDYPSFKIVQKKIKRNPNKKSYNGLTYEFMEKYILTKRPEKLKEFEEQRLISEAYGRGYPKIKQWFLNQFPKIAEYGVKG